MTRFDMQKHTQLANAAKAVGLVACDWDMMGKPLYRNPHDGLLWWPLYNDGDAFRLAAELKMNLYFGKDKAIAEIISDGDGPNLIEECGLKDLHEAMRRAIVKLAAVIGDNL